MSNGTPLCMPGPGGRRPGPRARARHDLRLGHRVAVVAVTVVAAACGGALLGPMAPAQAGGIPGRQCPPGARADIPAPQQYLGQPQRLRGGFYAQTGRYWPPTTAIACRVGPDFRHPLVRVSRDGCARGAVAFLIPDDSGTPGLDPGPTPGWGTFLPPGWYVLGGAAPDGWTAACWTPRRPATPDD